MQGKTKLWMVAAVVFIAFACILPEAVKPRYSEELEENAVVRMDVYDPEIHFFLLMPDYTLYYIEADHGTAYPNRLPHIVKDSVTAIKKVKLSEKQAEHTDDILRRIKLENSVYESTDTDIILNYDDTMYTGAFKYGSGAVESLYLAFIREFGMDFPKSEEFKSYS